MDAKGIVLACGGGGDDDRVGAAAWRHPLRRATIKGEKPFVARFPTCSLRPRGGDCSLSIRRSSVFLILYALLPFPEWPRAAEGGRPSNKLPASPPFSNRAERDSPSFLSVFPPSHLQRSTREESLQESVERKKRVLHWHATKEGEGTLCYGERRGGGKGLSSLPFLLASAFLLLPFLSITIVLFSSPRPLHPFSPPFSHRSIYLAHYTPLSPLPHSAYIHIPAPEEISPPPRCDEEDAPERDRAKQQITAISHNGDERGPSFAPPPKPHIAFGAPGRAWSISRARGRGVPIDRAIGDRRADGSVIPSPRRNPSHPVPRPRSLSVSPGPFSRGSRPLFARACGNPSGRDGGKRGRGGLRAESTEEEERTGEDDDRVSS